MSPDFLLRLLQSSEELALLDVREHGQYGAGHLFFAVPAPYSRLELEIGRLVPRLSTRVVLCDDGRSDVARRAARRLAALGYTDVSILDGGTLGWVERGLKLFAGVNVPSKAFGELVHEKLGTPSLSARELVRLKSSGNDLVIVDGRPPSEFSRMSIPGAVCCPNGELALRIDRIAPSPGTTIIVNCAGRTRSIIGAQTLRDLGVPNPVFALEDGTQGWFLAGFELKHEAPARLPEVLRGESLAHLRERSRALAARFDVPYASARTVETWLRAPGRTTYLFDVRTDEERASSPLPGTWHAPGGQLVQATDQWIGVRGARIVLADGDGVRAPPVAMWLRRMGHDAHVLKGDVDPGIDRGGLADPSARLPELRESTFARVDGARLIDLRSSSAYRLGCTSGAVWSIRPRIAEAAAGAARVGLIADDPMLARAAALDLMEAGVRSICLVRNAPVDEQRPGDLPDDACIDFVFFAHGRHEGNREAALRYLRWERDLVGQLADWELARFRLPAGDH